MELAQFLHIETRKCSWFAHWWMHQHHENPMELLPQRWVLEYKRWEKDGCPNPNNPGVLHWNNEPWKSDA